MLDPSTVVTWIEGHPQTVDLVKWSAVIVLAWAVGGFRYLWRLLRQPKADILASTSRCLIESFPEFDGHRDVVRATLLLELDVANLTNEPIVIRHFTARMKRQRRLWAWSQECSAVSLPNRVHHQMGSGVKLLRNWFAHFDDGRDQLTMDGKLGPKDAVSAFALFVFFTHGTWNPRIDDETVRVSVTVHLTTGEKLKAAARIKVNRDPAFFETMVPGILEQVAHPTAWNAPART